MLEIELKFLVSSEAFKKEAFKASNMAQGFLNSNESRCVRIRITGDKGFLTIKGESLASGLFRLE
ncbi:hypothetical protein SAMN04488027_10140 [Psychroflexus sediminis]|uniref:CYTH domain-containing protein n=1 Tax=Psychroflexus sediminis TaxID=470826 RepID=A0A1G7TUR4_9FLAO|nr:hypothetical protein SAMN04488027_10140 [Psychroflexus sediminis]